MLARLYKDTVPAFSKESGVNLLLAIRIITAIVFVVAGLMLSAIPVLRTVLFVLATVAAAYDFVHETIDAVAALKFFTSQVIFCFVCFVAFLIGYGREAAIAAILVQVGRIAIDFATVKTLDTAYDLLAEAPEADKTAVSGILAEDTAEPEFADEIRGAAGIIMKAFLPIALAYMIIVPVISNMSVATAIHRALAILIIASPAAFVVSSKLVGKFAICYSGALGVIVNGTETAVNTANICEAIIDKNGVYTESAPKVLSAKSDFFDDRTFLKIAANAVYYSTQSFADAIMATGEYDILESVISDFSDIPGYGVKLKIQGSDVTLATREFFSTIGIQVPEDTPLGGKNYYMVVQNKYMGRIVIRESIQAAADNLVANLKANGIENCTLLSEDSQETAENFGINYDFDKVIGGLSPEAKLSAVKDASNTKAIFIFAEANEAHSEAAIDVKVGNKSSYADILVHPDDICNLTEALRVCRRVRTMIAENAIMVMVVKALLVFLSMIGATNIWFAVFLDIAAQLAAILNVVRVTSTSFVDGMKK